MERIAWTPEGSVRGLGSVMIRMPFEELTRQEHLHALAQRIDRLVAKETPEVARALLDVLETEERLVAPRNLKAVGELLAENSERLLESMGGGFPVPRAMIRHEPETQDRLEEETLEEFLLALYPGEWD